MLYIKREFDTMDEYRRDYAPTSRSPDPSVPIPITNENWHGKSDPTERRRIQNRINQRAFRQRQRAGESPKQYRARASSSEAGSQGDEDEQQSSSPEQESHPVVPECGPTSAPGARAPNGITDPSTGRVWDELAQLINRNLMAAAANNAQHLGVDQAAVQSASAMLTPRSTRNAVPASLQPVPLQYQVPHDPIIDIIPHARFRYNILRAITSRQLDAAAFSAALRASGALESVQGQTGWVRGGLVVWSSPDQLASWELSESFVRRFGALLQGCEDLLAATNAWRSRRGERLFSSTVEGK